METSVLGVASRPLDCEGVGAVVAADEEFVGAFAAELDGDALEDDAVEGDDDGGSDVDDALALAVVDGDVASAFTGVSLDSGGRSVLTTGSAFVGSGSCCRIGDCSTGGSGGAGLAIDSSQSSRLLMQYFV